jgi:predicted AlkP superfamily phosphohydrolase/phosphomutase
MEVLVLGIDGGDWEVLRHFNMPFLHSLVEDNNKLPLEEDLVNRGWAEMLSGLYAKDNDSFYIKPDRSKQKLFTLKYSFTELSKNSSDPLIWEVAKKAGRKVGIMNVPTTYPAPEIEGFFVSGAGGGLYSVDGIPSEMCDSESTRKVLADLDYEIELRFKPSGIQNVEEFFKRTNSMMQKRFAAFKQLCENGGTEFGFLALRGTANLLYVIMSEVQRVIESGDFTSSWGRHIDTHFSLLDSLTKDLFETLKPKEFIVTSDHGLVPQKYHANYNIALADINKLNFKGKSKGRDLMKNIIKKGLNTTLDKNYIYDISGEVDMENTLVFGKWYSNGLFVNDGRFTEVVDDSEIDQLVDETVEKLNKHPKFIQHKINASPYRRYYKNAPYYDSLPDIKLDAPDEIFYLGRGKEVVSKSVWYKPIKTLEGIPTSMYTGTKGKHPLFIVSSGFNELVKEGDPNDLTLMYKIIRRYFE